MSYRATHKERTQLAFQAYLDLIDAAEWFKSQMRAPLESFDLTMRGFRLLIILQQEGARPITEPARHGCSRQNMDMILAPLEARRWVGRVMVTLDPAKIPESRLPIVRRGKRRDGPKIAVAGLTKLGKRFIGEVLPSHSKMVKALMRAIGLKQQRMLSRIAGNWRRATS
ncbi:MAG TPA: hypothetical protein VHX49_11450 [Candidatus Acidoferrales bacterium]|jgi:hypothetical protein|nr:hypothetical protein [Candidatus Acidoferrales bacterium]